MLVDVVVIIAVCSWFRVGTFCLLLKLSRIFERSSKSSNDRLGLGYVGGRGGVGTATSTQNWTWGRARPSCRLQHSTFGPPAGFDQNQVSINVSDSLHSLHPHTQRADLPQLVHQLKLWKLTAFFLIKFLYAFPRCFYFCCCTGSFTVLFGKSWYVVSVLCVVNCELFL